MKQIILTMITGLLITGSLSADNIIAVKDTDEGRQVFVLQTSKRDRLFWGPDIFWTDEAPQIKGIHIKDKSVYYGLTAGYDFLRPNAVYAGVDVLYALGRVHIKAQQNKTKFYKDSVNGSFARGEVRLGYNFHGDNPFYFSPFIGLGGYHVRPTSSVRYVQNWLYLTLGIKTDYEINSTFNLGLNIKGMQALYYEERFKKSHFSVSHHNTSNVLGYEVSLPFTIRMGRLKNWDARIEPYYTKLNSHNDANVAGGRLTFSYRF